MKDGKKYYWIAAIAFIVLILLHNTNLIVDHDDPATFFKFLGRFHPLVVHFPIVLILITAFSEWRSRKNGDENLKRLTTWFLGATALFSFIAVYIGMMLTAGETYDHDLLEWHERFAVLLTAGSTIAFLLRATPLSTKSWAKGVSTALIFASVLFMAIGADKGGSLTHGSDYLTKYLPFGGGIESEAIDYGEVSIYDGIVQPILTDKCGKCHGDDRNEGGLILTSSESFIEGGDDGPIVVEGSPSESELMRRLVMPMASKYHMPPEGERQLTPRESELIRWWIESGASFETPVPETETTDMAELILEEMGLSDMPTGVFALDVPNADSTSINKARAETGAIVMNLAEGVSLLQVATTNVQKSFGNDAVRSLGDVADQITWLDLGATQVDDGALEDIGKMKHLTKLHLEKTAVTDAGLSHLKGLEYLEYLNLYGTEVTDAGIEHIKDLPKLKALYLWQSKVTKEGAEKLRSARPGMEVNIGVE